MCRLIKLFCELCGVLVDEEVDACFDLECNSIQEIDDYSGSCGSCNVVDDQAEMPFFEEEEEGMREEEENEMFEEEVGGEGLNEEQENEEEEQEQGNQASSF